MSETKRTERDPDSQMDPPGTPKRKTPDGDPIPQPPGAPKKPKLTSAEKQEFRERAGRRIEKKAPGSMFLILPTGTYGVVEYSGPAIERLELMRAAVGGECSLIARISDLAAHGVVNPQAALDSGIRRASRLANLPNHAAAAILNRVDKNAIAYAPPMGVVAIVDKRDLPLTNRAIRSLVRASTEVALESADLRIKRDDSEAMQLMDPLPPSSDRVPK